MIPEWDYFQVNAIQHFAFCKRQWALITIEQIWSENVHTRLGHYEHELVDDPTFREKRKDRIIARSVPIISKSLGFRGIADVVEYHQSERGIVIEGYDGEWFPHIIEYKKGKPKKDNRDIMQLVLQVLCFEEMLQLEISSSALYYKQTNRRMEVMISNDLKEEVKNTAQEMRRLYSLGKTPPAEKNKNCVQCSLVQHCFPRMTIKRKSVENYVNAHVEEEL